MKHRLNSSNIKTSPTSRDKRFLGDWVLRFMAAASIVITLDIDPGQSIAQAPPATQASQAPRVSELSASAAASALKDHEIQELIAHLHADKGYDVDPNAPIRSRVIVGKQADTAYEVRLIARPLVARGKGTPTATVSLTQIVINGKVRESLAIAEIAGVAYKSEGAARSWHWKKWTFDLGRARNCVSSFAHNGAGACSSCYQQLSACINNYNSAGWWGTLSCIASSAGTCYTCLGAIGSLISCLYSCWHWI